MTADLRTQLQQALGDAYVLDRELGGGGMSHVFVATELALGRQVVVKVLPAEMSGQVSVERFKREISLAARLQHPHIVPLLTAGDAGGLPYFTMPLVEGESLRARLAKQGELPLNEAVRVLREIASALAYAHERGIVHRDIKPDNVLMSGGSAMITDFGVAKALSASSNAEAGRQTSLGVALGTPAYMAPEQASADPNVDHRADIYAFGVLAYELLTGQPPFVGRSAQHLLAAHVTEAPEQITKRRGTIPPALAALVMRCLEKRAADRPQAALDVVHALDQITTPSGGTQPTSAVPAYASGAATPASRRARGPLIAAAIVVIAAGGAFAAFMALRGGAGTVPKSLAVLPTEIGADTAHAYLSDGLSSELTTKLSKIPGLAVRAYSSSKVMKGRPAKEAGKELGVGAVVTATLVRAGSRLRITASLVNAADENVIWSDTFEESDQDQFALQDKLVAAIASALKLSLSPETKAAVTARGTKSAEAHELVQRARLQMDQYTEASVRGAIVSAEAAIKLDSTYADAWVELGNAWIYLADDFISPRAAIPNARPAVDRALALDPQNAAAHASQGSIHLYYGWDIPAAAREFERALQLDSANGQAAMFYAYVLRNAWGLADSARAMTERGRRLNPLSNLMWDQSIGDVVALRPDSADRFCARAATVSTRVGDRCRGLALMARGQFATAREAFRRALPPNPTPSERLVLGADLLDVRDTTGAKSELAAAIAGYPRRYAREDRVWRLFARLGEHEKAVLWLERAVASNSAGVVWVAMPAGSKLLGDDPRVRAIAARVKVR